MKNKIIYPLLVLFIIVSCKKEEKNQPPSINDQTFSIAENSPRETTIGKVIATDTESTVFTFEIISGNLDEAFAISNENGMISVQNEDALDYETSPVFALLVEVKDDEGESATATITVELNNLELPTAGLLLHLPFSGNGEDESNNNFDALVNGPELVSDRNNKENSAYYFDGIDDYMDIGDKDELSFSDKSNFTVSLWAEVKSFDRNQFIVSKYYSGSDNREYSINYTSALNSYVFGINDGNPSFDYLASDYTEGWHHIVGMKDDNKIYLFIDNELISEKIYTTNQLSSIARFMVGAVDVSNTSPDGFFHGNIDDVMIFNRALTIDEVKILYKE